MPTPGFSLLDTGDVELIHERTLDVLERTGVVFKSSAARGVLAQAGCLVDEETARVRLPRALVDTIVRRRRAPVLLAGRDPARDALLDGTTTYAATGGICPYIVDLAGGEYRQPSVDDLARAVRLAVAQPDSRCRAGAGRPHRPGVHAGQHRQAHHGSGGASG
jgi:trimethylamine--corrinoid protein Co-methyltransferase